LVVGTKKEPLHWDVVLSIPKFCPAHRRSGFFVGRVFPRGRPGVGKSIAESLKQESRNYRIAAAVAIRAMITRDVEPRMMDNKTKGKK
jgi:hypothetical protein